MQSPVSTGLSFVILLVSVGGAFAFVSANQISIIRTTSTPWFGFLGAPVTPELVQAAGLQEDHGVLITLVHDGSPAETAGLKGGNRIVEVGGKGICVGGDQIVDVNGQTLSGVNQLRDLRERSEVGDAVTLRIIRNGDTMDIPVILGEAPENERELTDAELQEACK